MYDRVLDYTTVVVSGRVWVPLTGLTTPVGWLLLPQLTVRSRSAIVVQSNFLLTSRCFSDFSVGVEAFVIGLGQIFSFPLETSWISVKR